jgi:hypothetical protein
VAVIRLGPRIDISQLKPDRHLRARQDKTAQNTTDRGRDRRRSDMSNNGADV